MNDEERIALLTDISDEAIAGHGDAVDFQKRVREIGDAELLLHNLKMAAAKFGAADVTKFLLRGHQAAVKQT